MFSTMQKFSLAVLAATVFLSTGVFAQEMSRNEARSPVSRQQAQQVALESIDGGRVISSDFNNRWFRDNDYEFVVVDDTYRYDIQVDATNGRILKVDQEPIFRDGYRTDTRAGLNTRTGVNNMTGALNTRRGVAGNVPAATAGATASTAATAAGVNRAAVANQGAMTPAVTPERARSIAEERSPNAAIVDMHRTTDSDRPVYNIEMVGTTTQIDMTIDGMDGRIVAYEESQLDRRDRLPMTNRALDNAERRAVNRTAGTTTR